ncbi:hypothetical protein Q9189_004147 [Teloschistes chrysophthalmus]
MDRLVARKLYSGEVRHLDAVADALEDLFFNEEFKYVLTSTAASMTVNFFFSNGKFARGREIFGRLQKLQRALHPSTFNIMLKAAAEQQNLFNFTYILKLMINCGVVPNVHTWLYLAQAIRNEEVRQLIVDRMNQKGYLKQFSVTPDAAALVIPQLAEKHMNSGEDPQSLIELLDQQFGSDWHHGRASERLIDEVGVRQSTERALSVLQTLEGRGYRPSPGLLMLLLRQCSWYRDHELAITLLRKFRLEYKIFPAESRICDVLFNQAWRSRLHNCCRVIWTYACISGCTSYDMQEKVKKSMCSERSDASAKKSRSVMWEEGAGHVITSRVGRISLHRLRRLMLMWQPAEPGKDRAASDVYLRVMRRLVDQDLDDVGKFNIPTPLDELLAEALSKDRLWAADRVMQTVPLECRYSQIYYPFRSIVRAGQAWREAIPRPLFSSPQEEWRDPEYRMSLGCCWMSARTRLRACICPEYIRKKPSDLQASDGEHESQARAEEAEGEGEEKPAPSAGTTE